MYSCPKKTGIDGRSPSPSPSASPFPLHQPFAFLTLLLLAIGCGTHPLSAATATASLVISEFAADSDGSFPDEDGDASDWIEIYNSSPHPVSLLHWSLSDSRNNPNKWRFPETNVAGGGFLVVFASEKNRVQPGRALHTNFKLSADGEYLGLTDPSGKTVSEYTPRFPKQVRRVSYGFGLEQISTSLISNTSPARLLIPRSAALDSTWFTPGLSDASWTSVTTSLGFDQGADPAEDRYPTGVQSFDPLIHFLVNETNGTEIANLGRLGTNAPGFLAGSVNLNQTGPSSPAFKGFETNNRAFRFTGTAGSPGRIRIPDSPALHLGTAPFTLGMWIFPTSIASRGDLFCAKDAQSEFSIQTSSSVPNQLTVFHNGVLASGGSLSNSTWYHIVVTRDAQGTLRAFQDGIEILETPDAQPFDFKSDLLWGSNHRGSPANAQFGFNGRMDEFFLLDRALSSEDVSFLFQVARLGPTRLTGAFLTDLQPAMAQQASSAYLRIPFVLSNPSAIDRLILRVRYDDGFAAYLNGQPLIEANAPSESSRAWNSVATTRRHNAAALQSEEFNLTDFRNLLRTGTNILAVQGFNIASNQNDFLLHINLESVQFGVLASTPRYFRSPSPGEPNGVGTADLGPIIGDVRHSPDIPADSDPLLVTAFVEPSFQTIRQVQLIYAVNFGSTNAITMLDDGLSGDGAAADGVYGALIPASAASPGQLIRYKIVAADINGNTSRWPLFEDPSGSPEFLGTVVLDPSLNSSKIPVWHWFARNPDPAKTRVGARVSVFYNGTYYDNVFSRERGGATSIGSQKFDFNRDFRAQIVEGQPKVDEANLNASGSDPTYIRPPLAFATYRELGNPACLCFPVLMRLNGRADRLANYVEQVDTSFLRRNQINDQGVLYKFVQRGSISPVFSDSTDGIEKKTHTDEPNQDVQEIVDAIKLPNLADRLKFFLDRFDIAQFINFLAIRPLTMDADDVRKNFYMYLDREGSGQWMIFPWDKDWTFGITGDGGENLPHPFFGSPAFAKPDTQANVLYKVFFNDPPLREMMLRRLRTVMDELLQPPWIDPLDYRYEPWVDQWASLLPNPNANVSAVSDLKAYFARRRQELYVTYNVLGTTNTLRGVVPDPQPGDVLIQFGKTEVTPASGNQDEEYFQLVNTNLIAVDVSGWIISGGVQHTLKPGSVIPAQGILHVVANTRAFRARSQSPKGGESLLVQGNYQGRLSARGETLLLHDHRGRFVDSLHVEGTLSEVQRHLRISEIMYAPAPDEVTSAFLPEDYEFIELANLSTSPLDISGVQLAGGIQFRFPSSPPVTMPALARWILARNPSAFAQRYPSAPTPVGSFEGTLNNGGETLTLTDARGEKVMELDYESDWYATTRGLGFSLVPANPQATYEQWDTQEAWRPGSQMHGTPGLPETLLPQPRIIITEVLAHSGNGEDAIEIQNQSDTPVDLSGWYVSDSATNPRRTRIPVGTLLQPGAFFVYRSSQWNLPPASLESFGLASEGEEVYLFAADRNGRLTGYSQGWSFGASDVSVTLGHWRNSLGKSLTAPLTSPTLGTTNAGFLTGPIVLGEIHYHPTSTEDGYIEIQNHSSEVIKLGEPTQPGLSWRLRGDVDYSFPTQFAMAPRSAVVIVPFSPQDVARVQSFVQAYQLRAIPRLLGPYSGKLPRDRGHLILQRPARLGITETNLTTPLWVDQEEVHYSDSSKWPQLADGYGSALIRRVPLTLPDDPASWIAAAPSPGVMPAAGAQNPIILTQPRSVIARAFEPALLTVSAMGTGPLHYQWLLNQRPIPGARSSSYGIRSVTSENEGTYSVNVFDQVGSVLSTQALVSIFYPPILSSPPTNRTVRAGQKTEFRVTALGHGRLTYQWLRENASIPGATNAIYTINSVGPTHVGSYTVQVQDQFGTTVSPPASLLISEPPQIATPPRTVSIVAGQPAVFSIEMTGTPPFTYRWRRGTSVLLTETTDSTTSFLVVTNTSTNALVLQGQTNFNVAIVNTAGGITNSFQIRLLNDLDQDGMADAWELQHQLNPSSAADSALDPDGDGFSNLEEYLAQTDPRDATSALKLQWTLSNTGQPVLEFPAQVGNTYSIEFSTDAPRGGWKRLEGIPARDESRIVRASTLPHSQDALFFRVVTPWRP